MAGLWRHVWRGGKYLVVRRDGTIPWWMHFVMAQADEAAPAGLRGYADKAEDLGYDPDYVRDIREMADAWEQEFPNIPKGDPDAPRHRTDDKTVVALMCGDLRHAKIHIRADDPLSTRGSA